ncbi:MAG: hypothetical protein HFE75_11365 [Firmicutes bacterium]|jgi:hypothetical protein|nr:hypothetical protein [Bacillota bacterium]
MTPCSNPNPVLTRIEKITKNQVVNRGSSPYNQMPEENDTSQNNAPQNSTSQNDAAQNDTLRNSEAPVLAPENMQSFVTPESGSSSTNVNQTIASPLPDTTPELIPNSPTFTVPANPLLPPGYQEVLDYNAIQYVNGFYRTQIGRYVRVEQLMGSNTLDTQEGYLIGVGINYIILQEAPTGNILIVDIYGIKNMYVYYTYRENLLAPLSMSPTSSGNSGNRESSSAENPVAQSISNAPRSNHLAPLQR